MTADWGYVPLVRVWRGETVESVHYGAIAVVDSSGRTLRACGDPRTVTYLRSAAKPAQVLPLLASGAAERFGFRDDEIAVMAGSHGGEPFHLEAVRSILGKIGLGEAALQCGAHAPHHRPSALALRRSGGAPTALHNNCSGKHAGMLALAVHLGAPVATYLEVDHPVQVRIRAAIGSFAGIEPGRIRLATDGCSAPTFAMPLGRAALLYARLADPGTQAAPLAAAATRVVAAMRRHPDMVAGTERLCTELMRAGGDELIAKIGAEGFYGLGFRSSGTGIGVALKISDGDGARARPGAAIEALRQLGVLEPATAEALRERFVPDPRTHRGRAVGRVEAAFDLGPR